MSNYVVKNYAGLGVDKNLTEIFQPIGSTTPAAAATNYKQGGADLNTIFAKKVSGNPAAATSYIVKGYFGNSGLDTDLKDIFQHDPLNIWSPLTDFITGGNGCSNNVYAVAIDSANNVYVGGDFTSAGGIAANYIAKWTPSLGTWSPLIDTTTGVNGCDAKVLSIDIDSANNVYVGGSFVKAGGIAVNYIAKWTPSSGKWSALGGGFNKYSFINAIAIDSVNNVYAGGGFINFINSGVSIAANNIAKWTPSSGTWSALIDTTTSGNGTNNIVEAIVVDSANNIYVGGWFTQAAYTTITVNYIAKWTPSSGKWSPLINSTGAIGVNDRVNAIAIDSVNNVYAGGKFIKAGGIVANHIAKWTPSSGSSGIWYPLINSTTGVNGLLDYVLSIAIDNANNVYVGGQFLTPYYYIAKWTPSSEIWSALGSGLSSFVENIAIDSVNNVYAGGWFTNTGGTTANHIAVYNIILPYITTGTVITSTEPPTYNTVLTWTTSGSITFLNPISNINYTLIGGGAGGNSGVSSGASTNGAGGSGGGNGITVNLTWTSTATTYTITLGSGGNPGVSSGASGSAGFPSSISGTNISVSASGGSVGSGGASGAGGSSGNGAAGGNSSVGGGGGGGGASGNNSGGNGGNGGSGGGNGGGGADGGNDANPGAPGQNNLGGGGGGGGGGAVGSFGSGGSGGSGSVVFKFNI